MTHLEAARHYAAMLDHSLGRAAADGPARAILATAQADAKRIGQTVDLLRRIASPQKNEGYATKGDFLFSILGERFTKSEALDLAQKHGLWESAPAIHRAIAGWMAAQRVVRVGYGKYRKVEG